MAAQVPPVDTQHIETDERDRMPFSMLSTPATDRPGSADDLAIDDRRYVRGLEQRRWRARESSLWCRPETVQVAFQMKSSARGKALTQW